MSKLMKERGAARGLLSWLVAFGVATALTACGGTVTEEPDAGPDVVDPVDAGEEPDAGIDAGEPVFEDTNIAVVRLTPEGTLDTTFGTEGVAVVDFAEGVEGASDSVWDLQIDGDDRIVLFGSGKAPGDRTDVDRYVARLTPAGELDTTFGTGGLVSLDIGGLKDNARSGIIEPDGTIVASGYTSQPTGVEAQSANAIVLQRITADGVVDNSFGEAGIVNSNPFATTDGSAWGMAEAYAVGRQSNGDYVTTGYGRMASSGQVDLVSFRWDADGLRDETTWGDMGQFVLDVAADNDRGRHMTVLADDRVLMAGSAGVAPSTLDAMLVLLDSDGTPDFTFHGTEDYRLYDLGGSDEAFFSSAVSADGAWLAAAGYTNKDGDLDGALVITPSGFSVETEFAGATKLSATGDDRFWDVVFDGSDAVLAAGFITEGTETQMVVARFNRDGTLDTAFGTDGVVRVPGVMAAARSLALQSDGSIVLTATVAAE